MPNEQNMPTDYDKYVKLAKLSKNKDALTRLTRFAYRYRLAEDFKGMIAPNIGRTLLGYAVITKLFLAYTAYEAAVRAARNLNIRKIWPHQFNVRYESQLAKKLRANTELESYLISYKELDPDLANNVKLFFDETTSDIICVAYALRNIFAHGELTATAIGTETKSKRKVFLDLSNAILDYSDEIFTLCVDKLEEMTLKK